MRKPVVQPIDLPGRSVPEWVGSSPDAKVPAKVRLRVFQRYQGRCYLTGRLIRPGDAWELEHVKPLHLARPGEILHRESNLAPALKDAHAEKTAQENTDRAKADRIRLKHLGQWPKSKTPLRSRGFQKTRQVSAVLLEKSTEK